MDGKRAPFGLADGSAVDDKDSFITSLRRRAGARTLAQTIGLRVRGCEARCTRAASHLVQQHPDDVFTHR